MCSIPRGLEETVQKPTTADGATALRHLINTSEMHNGRNDTPRVGGSVVPVHCQFAMRVYSSGGRVIVHPAPMTQSSQSRLPEATKPTAAAACAGKRRLIETSRGAVLRCPARWTPTVVTSR